MAAMGSPRRAATAAKIVQIAGWANGVAIAGAISRSAWSH
jgi:hypothetical protein